MFTQMKDWFFSLNGAMALSVTTLLSSVWRGFLDAMFVLPNDFGDEGLMQLAAIIFTLLFAGWAWALLAAWQGSRRGLVAAAVINGLVLLAVPISWLFFYCPARCRADAGIFNLANTLNLVLGLLAAVALVAQFRRKPTVGCGYKEVGVNMLANKTFLAINGKGIARATGEADGGWTVTSSLEDAGVNCLAADPLKKDVVYAGTKRKGVQRSSTTFQK